MDEIPAAVMALLDAERDALNQRFRARQANGARIDPLSFLDHLRREIVPLAGRTQEKFPERLRNVVLGLYDVSLDLFTASYLGAEAKSPWVLQVWDELLPSIPVLLAREPQRVAGTMCNAMIRIAEQPGARPKEWLTRMVHVAGLCSSVTDLLLVGRVAAWQAGMAQYRDAALAAIRELPVRVAAEACGVNAPADEKLWNVAIERLTQNRWIAASDALRTSGPAEIRSVGTVGAFRGFGGPFLQPPVVQLQQGRIVASDKTGGWTLTADAFGAHFGRVAELRAEKPAQGAAKIDSRGTITWDSLQFAAPPLAQSTSCACDGQTLAVTIATSHHIFLFARVGIAT